jgi:uncharacterized protein
MHYARVLDMRALAARKSFFLFGPRSTGKTTLLRDQFPPDALINLLRSSEYLPLAENPSLLEDRVREIVRTSDVVIIDEIQKLPALLDEVHHLIESRGTSFILTGSSGRKLKREEVNLLAGRAWEANLFPLVTREIPEFDLNRYLRYGGLPQVYDSSDPDEELAAYVDTYLREEVREEARVRNLAGFGRFLRVAAMANAEQVNFANVGRDCGLSPSTVRSWFGILADTFLGFLVEPWDGARRRKETVAPKFYLFDVGVWNFLRGGRPLDPGTSEYGKALEHLIAMELRAYVSYRRLRLPLTFWRTYAGTEVDFLVGDRLAVEVKSARRVDDKHLRGLRSFSEVSPATARVVVSLDENDRETGDGIRVLHWSRFLDALWSDTLV